MSAPELTKAMINKAVMENLSIVLPDEIIRKRSRYVRSLDKGIVREFSIQYDRRPPVFAERFCINIDSLPEKIVNHFDVYRVTDGPFYSVNQGCLGRMGIRQDRWWLVVNRSDLDKATENILEYAKNNARSYFERFDSEEKFVDFYSRHNKGFAKEIVRVLKG